MALRSTTLFLIIISYNFASCHLLPGGKTTREIEEKVREQRRIGQTRIQDRQQRSVSTLKVLDFSADNTQNQRDSKGEFTGATLEAGPLPENLTICSALIFFIFISTPEGHERGTFWRIIISFQSGTENID